MKIIFHLIIFSVACVVHADEVLQIVSLEAGNSRIVITGEESINLTVEATGSVPVDSSVRWRKNGEYLDGVDGKMLSLEFLSNSDIAVYQPVIVSGSTIVSEGQEFLLTVRTLVTPSNISSRFYIDSGENISGIIGFVVPDNGSRSRPILVRGIGGTLQQYGIQNTSELSRLAIFNSSGEKLIEFQPGYESETQKTIIKTLEQNVGAFPSSETDIQGRIQLGPGVYTLVGTSEAGDSGTTLLEVYFYDFSK